MKQLPFSSVLLLPVVSTTPTVCWLLRLSPQQKLQSASGNECRRSTTHHLLGNLTAVSCSPTCNATSFTYCCWTYRIKFRRCITVYKCEHGMAPGYLSLSVVCRTVSALQGRHHRHFAGRCQDFPRVRRATYWKTVVCLRNLICLELIT